MEPARRQDHQPLDLPLPKGVWRRVIRIANSLESVVLKITFRKGRVVAATTEEEVRIDD